MNRQPVVRALLALLLCTFWTGMAAAQTSTATIRGTVRDEAGQPIAATVTAVETETGYRRASASREDGAYLLGGLQPGTYAITVTGLGRQAQSRTLRVLIGQTLSADFVLQPAALVLEGITVTGNVAVETRTPEIATNVTQEQIENLPQQDRNFLNFAALAPGVTVSRDEMNRQVTAGGLGASRINVFIDGASYKNDILEGGVNGQDASRGNPFPQIAVREFRVITQNFKAEYQRAASAVITATTRSGTNRFEADAFVLGQNKDLVAGNPGAQIHCADEQAAGRTCSPEPEYERLQVGASVGGPIIQDRLHYFLAYEGNYQNRQENVVLGRQEFRPQFGQYEGTFDQPFRSSLFLGKLSFQPTQEQNLDVSWNGRFESDKRGFGGQNSFEAAENVRIRHNVLAAQHTFSRGQWLNQANLSVQRATWNPTALDDGQSIGLEYQNVIRIGARGTEQDFTQDRIALRNDLTYSGVSWMGDHVFKVGGNLDFLHYDVSKRQDGNPLYIFNPDSSLDVPIRARWGEGDPGMDERNVQFGLFVQDDWDVTPRLQLNLGVRWDAETNLFNNSWVTPDSIREDLQGFVPDSYFSNGRSDRPIFLGAFQPRLGFSYDVFGTGRTVVHGGFGIYYDREVWNRLLDERFRLQWHVRSFSFSEDGAPGTIQWQPQYLTAEGLRSIIDEADAPPLAEVFLLNNDTKPTRSHQWNLGIRQGVGILSLGATYRGVRGYNVLSWFCSTPQSLHGYCEGGADEGLSYRGVLLSTDEGRTWYDALDLTVEKSYTQTSRWGFTLAYTFADAERKGLDFFTLDFPALSPSDWPTINQPVERHRLVASGIVGLPAQFQLSTVIQLGSGIPFSRRDETAGWGPARAVVSYYSQDGENFRQVDLRLAKTLGRRTGARASLFVEAINLFDDTNYRGSEELYAFEGGTRNENFGNPQWWTTDPGRRVQVGLNLGF